MIGDELREELAALGQRLVFAEMLRQEAIDEVNVLWRQHHDSLSTDDVSAWTTLPPDVLKAMLRTE